MSVQVACPGCGAPIVFRIGSSLVTVCEHCHSVVARGDRNVDDLGKIAYLAETDSVVEVGLEGRYQGHAFEVLGAARLGHEAGGVWDEWYLAFDDDRWGWLAEAQGRLYLTFAVDYHAKDALPAFESLAVDQQIRVRSGEPPMVVAEKGTGKPLGAKGEIPYRLVPGETYDYADLSGPDRRFGTLDYSESPPLLFLGREVLLDELNLPHREAAPEHEPRQVAAVQVSCPQCGGSLELHAPDKTEHVGCPYCGSLLDATQGPLRFLHAAPGGPPKGPLPLGAKGRLEGVEYVVIGLLRRKMKSDIWYYWTEYLLYSEQLGFRWLEYSDRHWSFLAPLPPGSVTMQGNNAYYQGERYRWFQKALAEVDGVVGEFYWKVEVGEQVVAADFVHPPHSLSRELTQYGADKGEVNWSYGIYLPVGEVERAFGLKQPLPWPSTVAPSQPFPYSGIYRYWAVAVTILALLGAYFLGTAPRKTVFEHDYSIAAVAAGPEEGQTIFADAVPLIAGENIQIEASTTTQNFWLWVDGDLVEEQTGLVQGFSMPVEYYAGVEDGESWSEGSRSSAAYLQPLAAGQYTMRLQVYSDPKNPPLQLHVRVRQGVPRWAHWFWALVAVSAMPLGVLIYHITFESRRWRDSNVSEG